MIPTLAVLAFAPSLLALLRPLWCRLHLPGSRVNGLLGGLERRLTRWRETLVFALGILVVAREGVAAAPLALLLVVLIGLGRRHRHRSELSTADVLWDLPDLQPHAFLRSADQIYGPAGRPAELPETVPNPPGTYDFRDGSNGPLPLSFPQVFFLSSWMTRLCMRSGEEKGSEFLFERVDRATRMWGLAILRIARGRIQVEGFEKLDGLSGKRIFLFAHVSQTDFAFGFPALDAWHGTDREIKLRFIVAKDHFVDNPVIHSWSGIGKLILSTGMIAIERRSSSAARQNMKDAAQKVVDTPIDLAIYPQGTRARAQLDEDGHILDVGFYSSGRPERAADPLGHIKKGSGFLALDVVRALREQGRPLHLIPVGVEGAGRLLAKGQLAMRAGESCTYRIGEPITLTAENVEDLDPKDPARNEDRAREITSHIERALAEATRIDIRLEAIWSSMFSKPMPASDGLRRLFDHVLTLHPTSSRRRVLFAAFERLPEDVTANDLTPLFETLSASSSKARQSLPGTKS